MAKTRNQKPKPESHGGRREGSGRGSFFRGKSVHVKDRVKTKNPMFKNVPDPWSIRLTAKGASIGEEAIARLNGDRKEDDPVVSRNVFVEALIRIFGSRLTYSQLNAIRDR